MRERSRSPSNWHNFPLDKQERKTRILAYRVGRVTISSARHYPNNDRSRTTSRSRIIPRYEILTYARVL